MDLSGGEKRGLGSKEGNGAGEMEGTQRLCHGWGEARGEWSMPGDPGTGHGLKKTVVWERVHMGLKG